MRLPTEWNTQAQPGGPASRAGGTKDTAPDRGWYPELVEGEGPGRVMNNSKAVSL